VSKILLYTAITGDYDKPRDDIRVETIDICKDSMRSSRFTKCVTPDFNNYDFSIWMDGNTTLKVDPQLLIEELGNYDLMVYSHWRDCIYGEAVEELKECLYLKKPQEEIDIISEQMNRYKKEGYPSHNGLGVNTYIVRRHTKEIEAFNNAWWVEICKGSKQDQLSLNYTAWKLGIKIGYFKEKHFNIHKENTYFTYYAHNT
jgi:hypothetical protein